MSRELGIVAPKLINGELIEPDADERQHPDPVYTRDGTLTEVIEMFTLEDLKNIMLYVQEIHQMSDTYKYANYNDYVELLKSMGIRINHIETLADIDEQIDVLSGHRHRTTAYYYVKKNDVYTWLDNSYDIPSSPEITPIDKPLDIRNGYIPPIITNIKKSEFLGEIGYIHPGVHYGGKRKLKTRRQKRRRQTKR
jgi:hypothetical protein